MTPKLSILIPTTHDRAQLLKRLTIIIESQLGEVKALKPGKICRWFFDSPDVEVLTFKDNKEFSVGTKRNALLQSAQGEYIAFIDDDDRISDNYFKLIFEGIEKGVDCCSLKGIITENGNNPLLFEHSIKYSAYKTNPEGMPVRYERFPNHLNCIKASIAKQFSFPESNHGEDTDWATQIFNAGVIKSEHYIDEVIYYYEWLKK